MADERIEPFERHTDQYDRWFEINRFVYSSELAAIGTMLPPGSALEIGVGTGRFATPLGVTLGVDPSKRMATMAKDRGIDVVLGTAEALPLASSSVDNALMITTICFVDNPLAAMKEARRVLRPGGSLLIGFVDKDSALGRQYIRRRKESRFYASAKFYSVHDISARLLRSGFGGLRFAQTIFKPLREVSAQEPVRPGFGEGSFVTVLATRRDGPVHEG